jgi:hypothetical protein
MSKPGTIALSIFKPSDGTTYQLDGSRIAPDSEGYKEVTNTAPTTLGTIRYVNTKHTFEIRHNDSSFHSTFLADSDAKNHVWNLVVAEMDGFVLWYEDSDVNIISQEAYVDPNNGGFPYVIRMTSYGTAIARGTNLLYAYNKTQGFASAWQDSDSDNIPDGYDVVSLESTTFSNNIFNAVNTNANLSFIAKRIDFPITGINITLSSTNTLNTGNANLIITARNFSDSLLLSVNTVISTAINSVVLNTVSNTFTIRILLLSESANFDVDVSNPAIRLNGSTEYVDG